MSATPEVPFLKAARLNPKIILKELHFGMNRKFDRFFVYGDTSRFDYGHLPDNSIAFTTKEVDRIGEKPTIIGLNEEEAGKRPCVVAHPNLCFGYNPKHLMKFGFVDFKRHLYTTCSTFGFVR